MRVVTLHNIDVAGLHMHTGSDILDAGVFIQGAELLYDAAKNFKNLRFLDFGSGFKVAYKLGDYTVNIEEAGKAISESFNNFCKEYGRELEFWFEPGKYIVSEVDFLW